MKQKILWTVLILLLLGILGLATHVMGTKNNLPDSLQKIFNEYCADTEQQEQRIMKNLSQQWQSCEKYKDFSIQMSIPEQENTMRLLKKTSDQKMLKKFSCSKNTGWRAHIAGNKNTPLAILEFYSDDEAWVVRNYLGSNHALSESLAQKLSNDGNAQVLSSLARNPKVSEDILQKILDSKPLSPVEESLAYNRGTSENFQLQLAEKLTAPNALKALKNNPNVTDAVQKILEQRSSQ